MYFDQEIYNFLLSGNNKGLNDYIDKLLYKNIEPLDIINKYLLKSFEEIGRQFKNDELFIPEVIVAARTLNSALTKIKDMIINTTSENLKPIATIVIGTVQGDLHDIGKNMVSMMLKTNGFNVIDLGIDVSPEKFVASIKEFSPAIVGMSALLTTTRPKIGITIREIEKQDLRGKVKIIIGGAPVNQEFAQNVGADGYAPDAITAVDVCKQLLNHYE